MDNQNQQRPLQGFIDLYKKLVEIVKLIYRFYGVIPVEQEEE